MGKEEDSGGDSPRRPPPDVVHVRLEPKREHKWVQLELETLDEQGRRQSFCCRIDVPLAVQLERALLTAVREIAGDEPTFPLRPEKGKGGVHE